MSCPCCGACLTVTRPPALPPGVDPGLVPPEGLPDGITGSPVPTPIRRSFWRRRWVVASLSLAALVALLLSLSGPTWAGRLRWFGKSRGFGKRGRLGAVGSIASGSPIPNLPAPRPPDENEKALRIAQVNPTPLLEPHAPPRPDLPLAGRISPCLALTADPRRRLLITSSLDGRLGTLRWYDEDGLRLRGSCRIPGPAYQMAFDSARAQLWTVTSVARVFTLTPLGDYEYAIANVHLYDLRSLLESTTVFATPPELKPIQVFDERAPISGLILSPDGSHLFYLTQLGNGAVVKRIDLSRRQKDKEALFQGGGSTALAQAPGGGKLYVLAGGKVFELNPSTMTLGKPVRVGGSAVSLCAGEGGRLFISERRQGLVVHVIDFSQPEILASWKADLEGRLYLRSSPDGKRIYLGSSALLNGTVRQVDVSAPRLDRPILLGQALSNQEQLLRGTLMVSPDGHYLVTGSGLVFRTQS